MQKVEFYDNFYDWLKSGEYNIDKFLVLILRKTVAKKIVVKEYEILSRNNAVGVNYEKYIKANRKYKILLYNALTKLSRKDKLELIANRVRYEKGKKDSAKRALGYMYNKLLNEKFAKKIHKKTLLFVLEGMLLAFYKDIKDIKNIELLRGDDLFFIVNFYIKSYLIIDRDIEVYFEKAILSIFKNISSKENKKTLYRLELNNKIENFLKSYNNKSFKYMGLVEKIDFYLKCHTIYKRINEELILPYNILDVFSQIETDMAYTIYNIVEEYNIRLNCKSIKSLKKVRDCIIEYHPECDIRTPLREKAKEIILRGIPTLKTKANIALNKYIDNGNIKYLKEIIEYQAEANSKDVIDELYHYDCILCAMKIGLLDYDYFTKIPKDIIPFNLYDEIDKEIKAIKLTKGSKEAKEYIKQILKDFLFYLNNTENLKFDELYSDIISKGTATDSDIVRLFKTANKKQAKIIYNTMPRARKDLKRLESIAIKEVYEQYHSSI